MDIFACERYAKNHGFDTVKFKARFPAGEKECKWLDAYFGMFRIEGMDGFILSRDIDKNFPNLQCEIIEEPA